MTSNLSHPQRRMSDQDKVIRVGDYIEKWFRLLWPFIVGIAGWYAHSIREPLAQIPVLTQTVKEVQQTQSIAARVDSVSIEERRELRSGMMIIIRILCNDNRTRDVRCDDIPIPSGPAFK